MPFLFAGGILATIGTGLIYSLDIGSSSGQWIGYQVLAGIGTGLAIQVPIIANQAFVPMSEISSVTAITLCKFLDWDLSACLLMASYSLSNHWWRFLRLCVPDCLCQSSSRPSSYHCSRCEPSTGCGDWCDATTRGFLSG